MSLLRALVMGGALYAAPAVVLASLFRGGELRRWCLGAALSPIALGLSVLPLRLLGMDSFKSGAWALGAWTLLALLRRAAVPGVPRGGERRALRAPLALSLLVFLPALFNAFLRTRSDAWFHAAVEAQVRMLPLPPQDPYYAGLQLQYFWFFHLVLSVFDSVAGIRAFEAMWLFNCAYFALTMLGVWSLSRAAGAREPGALWAPWLVAAGANPFGWAWILVHWARDPAHWHGVTRHLPDYVLNLVGWGYTSAALAFSMDKFVVGTAFSWGLALFAWWAACSAEYLENGRIEAAVGAGAVTAAALLVHTVAGFTLVWAGALGALVALAPRPSRQALSRTAILALCMAVGLALVYPYLRSVTQGKTDGGLPGVGINRSMVWTTLWVGAGMLPPAIAGAAERWNSGHGGRWLVATCFALLGVSCLLRLVFGNEGKFMHLSLLLLAALAAEPARDWLACRLKSGVARACAMAAVFAPTTAVVLACVFVTRGRAEEKPYPPEPGPEEARTYEWIRSATAPGSALLTRPGSLEALVRAERAQLWSESNYAVNWGYPPSSIEPRRRAALGAFGTGLGPADMEFLKSLRSPIYRVSREHEAPELPGFVQVHREGSWVVERLTFTEAK